MPRWSRHSVTQILGGSEFTSNFSSVFLMWVDCGWDTAFFINFLQSQASFTCITEKTTETFCYFSTVILLDRNKNCPKLSGGFLLFGFVFFAVGSIN